VAGIAGCAGNKVIRLLGGDCDAASYVTTGTLGGCAAEYASAMTGFAGEKQVSTGQGKAGCEVIEISTPLPESGLFRLSLGD